MPHKDPEKRREYARQWARRKYANDPNYQEKLKLAKRNILRKCDQCGKEYRGRKGSRFCSRKCSVDWLIANDLHNSFPRGGKPANYKGRTFRKEGYVMLSIPNHPYAQKNGRIFEHRVIMEQVLGRYLHHWEKVHHINGIKSDNRPENLMLVVTKVHLGEVCCPFCQKKFLIR